MILLTLKGGHSKAHRLEYILNTVGCVTNSLPILKTPEKINKETFAQEAPRENVQNSLGGDYGMLQRSFVLTSMIEKVLTDRHGQRAFHKKCSWFM